MAVALPQHCSTRFQAQEMLFMIFAPFTGNHVTRTRETAHTDQRHDTKQHALVRVTSRSQKGRAGTSRLITFQGLHETPTLDYQDHGGSLDWNSYLFCPCRLCGRRVGTHPTFTFNLSRPYDCASIFAEFLERYVTTTSSNRRKKMRSSCSL